MQLRLPKEEDFAFYYQLKCQPSSIYWGGFEKAPDQQKLKQHFLRLINKEIPDRDFYILEDDLKEAVGYLQLTHNSEKEIEIGYGVSEQYRGHGFGSALLSYAKSIVAQMEGIVNLIGFVREDNFASKKCFINNGFVSKEEFVTRYFALDGEEKKMFKYEWNKTMN